MHPRRAYQHVVRRPPMPRMNEPVGVAYTPPPAPASRKPEPASEDGESEVGSESEGESDEESEVESEVESDEESGESEAHEACQV